MRCPAFALSLCLLAAAATATTAPDWTVERVGTGTKPEIALTADDQPRIAFMTEAAQGGVFYARRLDPGWQVETVAQGYFYGPLDLAIDAGGVSHIVYHDHQSQRFQPNLGDAVYAADVGGKWELEVIRDPGHDGWDGSIALGPQGGVYVATIDPAQFGSTDGVEWGRREGGDWVVTGIGSGPIEYEFGTAIAVSEAGDVHIAYHDGGERLDPAGPRSNLLYAVVDPESGQVVIEVVDADGDVGKFPSLTLDREGRPHLAYFERTDSGAGYVKYAVRGDDGVWTTARVDRLDDVSISFLGARRIVSLALDAAERPHLAYADRASLRFARQADDGTWRIAAVATPADGMAMGQLASLALDASGRPHITWYELPQAPRSSTGDVYYAVGPTPVVTAVTAESGFTPAAFALAPGYPNPFNGTVVIPFELSRSGRVDLTLFNLAGQPVRTLVREVRTAGAYTTAWDGRDAGGKPVASGVYLARLRGPGGVAVRKLTLLQ